MGMLRGSSGFLNYSPISVGVWCGCWPQFQGQLGLRGLAYSSAAATIPQYLCLLTQVGHTSKP